MDNYFNSREKREIKCKVEEKRFFSLAEEEEGKGKGKEGGEKKGQLKKFLDILDDAMLSLNVETR